MFHEWHVISNSTAQQAELLLYFYSLRPVCTESQSLIHTVHTHTHTYILYFYVGIVL